MTKKLRDEVKKKFGGRCAYCGVLAGSLQIDHIVPIYRDRYVGYLAKHAVKALETIDTLNPSCRRCNIYKSVLSLEDFRIEVSRQVERARRYSLNFRMAEDFGLIKETGDPVVFFFERMEG